MKKDRFKDAMFEMMNGTEDLAIADIVTNDHEDRMDITLLDGSKFEIYIVEENWLMWLYEITLKEYTL